MSISYNNQYNNKDNTINTMHPKYTALFTSVNLLLGVGPLILPMPFFKAGIILSIIWLIIISFLSYNSAMFIAESMAKIYHFQYHRDSTGEDHQDSLISNSSQQNSNQQINQQSTDNHQKKSQDQDTHKQYDHSLQFEILFGEKWKYFPCITIAVYLTGTCISKCIMTGNTLSKVFRDVDGPDLFDDFRFWLCIFFVCGALFSFKSIEKTKVMQTVIIGVRLISIILFFFGAIYLIITQGVKELKPPDEGYFNISNFVEIFSNSVFSLMFHHSFPSIVSKLPTTEDVDFVGRAGFLISGLTLIVIPLTASMAFGKELGTGDKLIYYNFDFQHRIDLVYWVTSFYVFLNIAAFSVYVIVIRTYLLKMMKPSVNPRILSRQTLISSILILLFVLLASWFLQDQIQIVLDFTGGVFGIVCLFVIPSLEVWKARKKVHQEGSVKNYIVWLPIVIFVLGMVFMGFNLWHIIQKL